MPFLIVPGSHMVQKKILGLKVTCASATAHLMMMILIGCDRRRKEADASDIPLLSPVYSHAETFPAQ